MFHCKDTEHDFEYFHTIHPLLFCRKCALIVDIQDQLRCLRQRQLLRDAPKKALALEGTPNGAPAGPATMTEGATA